MQRRNVPGKPSEHQVPHGESFALPKSLQLYVTAPRSYNSPPRQVSALGSHC